MKTKPTTNEPPPTSTTFAGRQARASYYAFLRFYFEHNGSSRKMSWKTAKKKLTKRSLPEEPLRREEAPSKKGKNQKIDSAPRSFLFCKSFSRSLRKGPNFVRRFGLGWGGELLLCCAGRGEDAVLRTFWTTSGHIWWRLTVVGMLSVGQEKQKKKREDLLEWSQHRQVETWYHYSCLFWSCILALKIRHHLHEMCVNSLNIAYNILKTLAASWRLPKPT